ncbi:MAG: hypothetical protein Q7S84_05035 [bacterium]|nr:hypothetical protein [bacterium]
MPTTKQTPQSTGDSGPGITNKPGIELVLNGGQRVLDAATLPIEWFFSADVIATKQPTYIVLVVQNKREANNTGRNMENGRRLLLTVSQTVTFLQLFDPGYHRMAAIVFGEGELENAKNYLVRDDKCYRSTINWEKILERGTFGDRPATTVEFEVPEQVFAPEPPDSWQKKWINYLHKEKAKDECVYTRRKIYAFLVKPEIVALRAIGMLIAGIFYSLYVIIGCGILAFIGYRPESPIELLSRMIKGHELEFELRRYQQYRRWSYDTKTYKDTYLRVTPFEVLFILASFGGFAAAIYYAWFMSFPTIFFLSWLVAIGGIFLLHTIITKRSEKWQSLLKQRQEGAEKRAKIAEEEKYRAWLTEYLNASKKPSVVDLNNVPKAYGSGQRVVQWFTVNVWKEKMRHCKPFARQ